MLWYAIFAARLEVTRPLTRPAPTLGRPHGCTLWGESKGLRRAWVEGRGGQGGAEGPCRMRQYSVAAYLQIPWYLERIFRFAWEVLHAAC